MANRATKSLTAGMKILGGANIPTYTLEYLTSAGKKKQGDYETIVVPYVELGRDSRCAVRFGDDTPTVSRKHAAIERKDNETFIINLSQSNPTLVNGRPVEDRYYLNNGDEIQLSMEGPRLRFNTTKEGTAKIGFTNKFNLVMQQAIRPYRTAVYAISGVLLVGLAATTFALFKMQETIIVQRGLIDQQIELTQAQADSIRALNAQSVEMAQRFQNTQQTIERERAARARESAQMQTTIEELRAESERMMRSGNVNYAEIIEPLKPFVVGIFLNRVVVEFAGERIQADLGSQLMCTGFMKEGGIFVTARHCVDLYGNFTEANVYEHNGGSAVFHFTAKSFDGSLQFDFTNKQLQADYSQDRMRQIQLDDGTTVAVRVPQFFQGADWAYMQTSNTRGLKYDKELSRNLRAGTNLFVLGYSYGMRLRDPGNLEPYFTTAIVTLSGLMRGVIQAAEAGSDGGNSGGPVFTLHNGEPTVIGIVTGAYEKIDIITPLANY